MSSADLWQEVHTGLDRDYNADMPFLGANLETSVWLTNVIEQHVKVSAKD